MYEGPRSKQPFGPHQKGHNLFRIAQEALANIGKYAQAKKVTISLDTASQATCLTIADDGCGFDASARHQPSGDRGWGLTIMRERAAAVGAELTIGGDRPYEWASAAFTRSGV